MQKLRVLLLGMLLSVVSLVSADTSVDIVDTYPQGSHVMLGKNQHFFLLLRYRSDQPTHLWTSAFYQGQRAKVGSNPSRIYPAGSGEALGWFFFFDAGEQVDEIRISAGDGSYDGTKVVASYPIDVFAGTVNADDSNKPEWAEKMLQQDQQIQQAAYEAQMNKPITPQDMSLLNGFMLFMLAVGLAGIIFPVWGIWRWHGIWKLLAAAPAGIMAFVVLRLFIDTAIDPTSHNLWPFEIIMFSGLSVIVMTVLKLIRKIMQVDEDDAYQ